MNGCTSSIGTVTLSANQGANAVDGSASTCENETLIGGVLGVTGGVPPYTFVIVTNGTLGTAVITNPTTGTFNYTPDPDAFGTDFFTFQVTDSSGIVCNTGTETITIGQNPTTIDFGVSGCADQTTEGDLNQFVITGLPPFTFAATGATVGGAVTVSSTGLFTFTPTPGFSGQANFGYQVTGANGCSWHRSC